MTFEWKLYARNPDGDRAGEIDDFIDAKFTPVYNDVGTWEVTMDRRVPIAVDLASPQWGIILCRNNVPIFSGMTNHSAHTVDQNTSKSGTATNQVIVSGLTDEAWLTRRVVSPSPAESVPPYTAQAYDDRTGQASTVIGQYVNVNAGPGAIVPRRVPNLTIAADPHLGSTVTGHGRWDTNLLVLIQPLASAADLGFRVAQVGSGIQFQIYQGIDRSKTVSFSNALGNLSGFQYESTAPTSNYAYVGASGSGTARVLAEYPDSQAVATWGRIEGPLVNDSGTTDPNHMAQSGADAITQGSEQATLTITPIETPTLMYGVHYNLGDKVTVQLEGPATSPYAGGTIVDILRSVEIHLTPDGPQTVTPTIGTAARKDVLRVIRAVRDMQKRLNLLERQ
jgi:hypothetical protein